MPRLRRRHAKRNAVLAVIAAFAFVGFGWMLAQSRRETRVIAVASAPTIVTVPVPIAVHEPPPAVREPPAPRTQSRRAVAPQAPPAAPPPAARSAAYPPRPTQTALSPRADQASRH